VRAPLDGLRAITFDFGNTLVPVDRAGLRGVVEITARAVIERCGPFDYGAFMRIWAEERERQFREEVPRFREVDLAQRVVRVLARLRGMRPPAPEGHWDDDAAASLSAPGEIALAVDVYSRSFVEAIPAPSYVGPLLERLAHRHRLAVLSNWPLAATIDRYVEAAGWAPYLRALVISQRVGAIKPHQAIFRAAEAALDLGPDDRSAILHVGDDWVADVVGAKRAGWRAAFLHSRPEDSPLPSSERDEAVAPDLELSDLRQLEGAVGP
jgi:FMN phosphatase YigB (HAD superfamily)